MSLYFDTCAVNRLTDDLSQDRIRKESNAVQTLLEAVAAGDLEWIVGPVLSLELGDNPDQVKRGQSLALLQLASGSRDFHEDMTHLALTLESLGLGSLDALHLAFCEHHRVEHLITVDTGFINKAGRRQRPFVTEVIHPVDFIQRGLHGNRTSSRTDD